MPKIDRSTDPETIREFRRHTGLTQQRLGELLGCTNDAISGFERNGAPGWMRYALFGVAVKEIGLRAEVAARLVGVVPSGPLLDRVPPLRETRGADADARAPLTKAAARAEARHEEGDE